MSYITRLLLAILWCQATSAYYDPYHKSFSKSAIARNSSYDLIYTTPDGTRSFYYAFCRDSGVNDRVCEVTEEMPVTNQVTHKKTCPVHVWIPSDPNHTGIQVLRPLRGGHRVLLLNMHQNDDSGQDWMLEVYIVRLQGTCSVSKISLGSLFTFKVYTGTRDLELLYSEANGTGRCRDYLCRRTYRVDDGALVRGPTVHSRKPEWRDELIHQYWEPLLVGKNVSYHRYSIIDANGTFTDALLKIQDGETTEIVESRERIATSDVSQELGACHRNEENLTCRRYGPGGSVRIDVSVPGFPWEPHLELQNLSDDVNPFMLVAPDLVRENDSFRFDKFRVYLIGRDGSYGYPLEMEIEDFRCSRKLIGGGAEPVVPTVQVEETDVLCFQFVCSNYEEEIYSIKFTSKCLPKNYFVVSY